MSEKRPSPENVEFNRLKGKGVVIRFKEGGTLVGQLVWVDFHTIGVLFDENPNNATSIVYKSSIQAITLAA